jgi:hypothetical protein
MSRGSAPRVRGNECARRGGGVPGENARPRSHDREIRATAALLAVVLVIGLATASDYGITTDEFIFDGYGPRALAWYASRFTDESQFSFFDVYLYGPWFQILVALAQSLRLADPFTVRHALTFVVGFAGIAALLPIGRLAVGRWAGFAAIVLCLTTGNLYGHLFFTPYDLPFLSAMTWATLAVVAMSSRTVPTWRAAVAAGFAGGLAIATRFGGLLAQAYLVGAMALCAIEAALSPFPARRAALLAIAARTAAALVVGWGAAWALWPWLQIGNPITQFTAVYDYFVRSYVQFSFQAWGETLFSGDLPWHYIPGQLLARLPEGFVVLLACAALFGVAGIVEFAGALRRDIKREGVRAAVRAAILSIARARAFLVIVVAALGPPLFVMARGSVVFDGMRHVLFILPPLALLAAWALRKLLPFCARHPRAAASVAGLHLAVTIGTMAYLHPLEYIAMNAFAGGTAGAFGRFDLDYWSAAATDAARRLAVGQVHAAPPPHVTVCIGYREDMVAPLLPPSWIVEEDPRRADFVITTERSSCRPSVTGPIIDRVERFHRTFATTIAVRHGTAGGATIGAPE